MTTDCFRFDRFTLDAADRRLRRDGEPVELNARYLDALCLLVGDAGKLIPKERFLDEVWRGVPVTDEALTQCIRTLRKQLGDEAGRPRFIETVPKHGYRFIAAVSEGAGTAIGPMARPPRDWARFTQIGAAGTIGGGLAGLIGGIIYGFAASSQPLAPGMGAVSMLLVLTCLTIVVALTGGAGVSFGIAAAHLLSGRFGRWSIAGGAVGGLLIGAVVKLLGLDAFNLLLGRGPGEITGAFEGLLIGAAAGLGVWLGGGRLRRSAIAAGGAGAIAGAIIPPLGGHLMAGSLAALARTFPESRLRLDQIGGWVGETGFGPSAQIVTGALEGVLFCACVAGSIAIVRKTPSNRLKTGLE